MKALKIKKRENQHNVSIFGGRLHENKPLSGDPLYSNLIYWAHVEAPSEGEFPMHPHEGIEILTFIFEGALEHFDTATNKFTELHAGGVQHIMAGSGLQHSEKYKKGSRAFQIWFDPNFNKALSKSPFYKDYQPESFKWEKEGDIKIMTYVSNNGPIKTDAPGITIKRYELPKGQHDFNFDIDKIQSIYLLSGELDIEGSRMMKDSFTKIENLKNARIVVGVPSDIFILESPATINYKRVID